MKRSTSILALTLLPFAALGQETVTLAAKPKDPKAGRVLAVREVFRISDAQGGFFLRNPTNLQPAPDGGVMAVDEDEFLRFNASGKFVVDMFRKGQGPGEFRQIGDYLVRSGEVLAFQESPMKCVLMGLDGKMLRDYKPDAPASRLLGRYGDRLLTAGSAFPAFDRPFSPATAPPARTPLPARRRRGSATPFDS